MPASIRTSDCGDRENCLDPRVVERKKYGKAKARRSFQVSKR